MPNGWTIGASGGNKAVTQPTIGTSGGNKDATQVWQGTSGGNKLVWPELNMVGGLYDSSVVDPADAACFLNLYTGGTMDCGGVVQSWIVPNSLASGSYEVRATVTSGTLSGGTTGTWLALSSSRQWWRERTTPGVSSCTLLIEIRTEGVTVYSDSFTLQASVTI